MAKGFKHGGSGGGAGLNFKVVGNPQPAAPSENTIWVNTDIDIPAWYFSATQPENMTEGDVWFSTGTPSTAEFNALKKNGIQVYPKSAKQYVGGAWVDVEAKSYQGGEWSDWWVGQLFSNGNQWESITGGWVDAEQINASYAAIVPIQVGDSIVLNPADSSGYRQCVAVTKNTIDTTGFTAVDVNIENLSTDGHEFVLWILSSISANAWGIVAQMYLADGENSISITTPGKYYIAIGFVTTKSVGGYAEITEVRLVK